MMKIPLTASVTAAMSIITDSERRGDLPGGGEHARQIVHAVERAGAMPRLESFAHQRRRPLDLLAGAHRDV